MKTLISVSFFFFLTLSLARANFYFQTGTNAVTNVWHSWKQTFSRVYHPLEENHRMNNFFNVHNMVNSHNEQYHQQQKPFMVGTNEFADMTDDEFRSKMMGLQNEKNCENASMTYKPPDNPIIPDNVDYREHGYVTPIKSQGDCGACWAFVAIGALEGQLKRITGSLVELSEQNLIDCSSQQGNMGCNGGIMCRAYEYATNVPGVATEASYPYTGDKNDGKCHYSESEVGAPVGGYLDIPVGDEKALQAAVGLIGPVAAGFDGSPANFRYYKDGIFMDDSCDSDKLTHAVTIIGYGTENNTDYWLVKNSWGPSWGNNGYGKVIRNYNNHCGIASRASFPVLHKKPDGTPLFDGPAAT